MLEPLLKWLTARRWIRTDSIVVEELPVNGRRIDVSVLTRSGSLSAFELKMSGFGRALEQAYYNRRLYDRSWVVLGAYPKKSNLNEAELAGIGVLVFRENSFEVLAHPGPPKFENSPRRRILEKIRKRASKHV